MEANDAAELMDQERQTDRFKERAAVAIAVLAMLLAIQRLRRDVEQDVAGETAGGDFGRCHEKLCEKAERDRRAKDGRPR